jgi:hypothetical protein
MYGSQNVAACCAHEVAFVGQYWSHGVSGQFDHQHDGTR